MSNLSRRSLVASAAALPALAVPAVAVAAPADTLARIAEHRRMTLLIDAICERIEVLERTLPEDRQVSGNIGDRGTDVGKDDDPRWTAVQNEYWTVSDARDAGAFSFINRPPVTTAGVVALIAYTEEHEHVGYEWPNLLHYYDNAGRHLDSVDYDWRQNLMRALASCCERLAVQS
jgi:hypothetical protein